MGRLSDSVLGDDLFLPTKNVRASDPDTSRAAANKMPVLRGHDRKVVLASFYTYPEGLTDFELADIVGRQQTSAGKRRGELRDEGFIEDSGLRRYAPSGSKAIVWKITQAGINQVMSMLSNERGTK